MIITLLILSVIIIAVGTFIRFAYLGDPSDPNVGAERYAEHMAARRRSKPPFVKAPTLSPAPPDYTTIKPSTLRWLGDDPPPGYQRWTDEERAALDAAIAHLSELVTCKRDSPLGGGESGLHKLLSAKPPWPDAPHSNVGPLHGPLWTYTAAYECTLLHPVPIPQALVDRCRELTKGVDVDLTAPLPPEPRVALSLDMDDAEPRRSARL